MPGAKVIGRILSLGYPMPGVQVDNYNLLSAPSFFDYDALVVDPHATARYVRDVLEGTAEGRTFSEHGSLPVPQGRERSRLRTCLAEGGRRRSGSWRMAASSYSSPTRPNALR